MLRLDLASKKLTELPMLNMVRYSHSSTIADNTLAVFAGHSGHELLSTIEIINLKGMNAWRNLASEVLSPRMNPVVCTVGPRLVLVSGGSNRVGELLTDVMLFDTESCSLRKLFDAEVPFESGRNN